MVQAGDCTDVNDQERDPGAVLGVETGGRCERWYGRQDEDPRMAYYILIMISTIHSDTHQ